MALTKTLLDRKFYDGKKLWETFMSWGAASSVGKLREWCKTVGMVNPASGETSQMGPYWSMWKYAFENPDEAYPHYERWVKDQLSQIMEKADFTEDFIKRKYLEDLAEHAKHPTVANRRDYLEFCRTHGIEIKSVGRHNKQRVALPA